MMRIGKFRAVVCVTFSAVVCALQAQAARTLYWNGAEGANASVAANWLDGNGDTASLAPTNGDTVVFRSGASGLSWDIDDVSPGGWIQEAGFVATNVFYTGSATNSSVHGVLSDDGLRRELVIEGNVVLSGGVWTHKENPSNAPQDGFGVYRLFVRCGGAFTLGANARIDVKGKGYTYGRGVKMNVANVAPSHGGRGMATSRVNSPVPCYGDVYSPETLGSSGSNSSYTGPAGGVVHLTVAGALALDGCICADGREGKWVPQNCITPPTGGSVNITASSISGTGGITAIGAPATSTYPAGGGGRIAVRLTGDDADFSGISLDNVTAHGGIRYSGAKYEFYDGSAGTIYLETKADGERNGTLVVKGSGGRANDFSAAEIVGEEGEVFTFREIVVTNGARVAPGPGVVLKAAKYTVAEDEGLNNGLSLYGGELVIPGEITEGRIVCVEADSVLRPVAGDVMTLCTNATLVVNRNLTVASNLVVKAGARVVHSIMQYDFYGDAYKNLFPKIDLEVPGDLVIDEGGAVDVTGLGYRKRTGPGIGTISGGTSASHGGISPRAGDPKCYGDIKEPVDYGTGANSDLTDRGGGAVKITVGGTLTVNGAVKADGSFEPTGNVRDLYNASAGGSVWLSAGSLVGNGRISANGVAARSAGYFGSGGGRVAVYFTDDGASLDDFDGVVTAYGGDSIQATEPSGGAGTMFFKTTAQLHGTLVIDNNGLKAWEGTTDISSSVASTEFDDVVLRNGASLRVREGNELVIHGDLTTDSSSMITNEPGGTVRFTGADTVSTLSGTNSFTSFVCESPGKRFRFAGEGSFFEILPQGDITLKGTQDAMIDFASTDEAPWYMKLGSQVVQDISFVSVSHSDASAGVAVSAIDSENGEDNVNWLFSTIVEGAVNAWTGAADGDWANANNWSLNRLPADTDNIVIVPSANSPVLSNDLVIPSLTVEEGASLALSGFDVTVGDLTVNGSLVCLADENVTVCGDVDFSGGSLAPARALFVLTGDAAQTVDFSSLGLCEVRIEKTGGSVAFASGFTVEKFTDLATAAHALVFAPEEKLKAGFFIVDGRNGDEKLVTLSSASSNAKWLLEVTSASSVFGVVAGGCDASQGLAVCAYKSLEGASSNVNWSFADNAAFWTGSAGSSFTEPLNWADGAVPTENDHVVVESGSVVISEECRFRNLALGSPDASGSVSFTVSAPVFIDGDLTVNGGAVLAVNKPLCVTGDAHVASGGIVTHDANKKTQEYWLDLTVDGRLIVDDGGSINASNKGLSPGNHISGGNGSGYGGLSHAGTIESCYGSVYCPTNLGSAGPTSHGPQNAGGALKITVGGEFVLNGIVDASATNQANYYASSGGSVWITAGVLSGEGAISAYGGRVASDCSGGGGRIAIHQTVADDFVFEGTVTARGGIRGTAQNSVPYVSAGSVYIRNAGEGMYAGVCIFDNNCSSLPVGNGAVVPALKYGDKARCSRETAYVLKNGGFMTLGTDLVVKELEMGANTKLDLNGHKLRVLSTVHKDRRGWAGTVVENGGSISWGTGGFAIIVR